MNRISILAGCTLLLAAELALAATADIKGMRVRLSPERTRIVFDLPGPLKYKISTEVEPQRLVIDIKRARLRVDTKAFDLTGMPIKRIRDARRNQDDWRVVLDLTEEVSHHDFMLKPIEPHGYRLVLDIKTKAQRVLPVVQKADLVSRQMRDIIVFIDAGHGGDDPGALGPGGLQEKNVVMKVSSKIARLFNQEPGFKAKLVRKGDYYISLRKRTAIAKQSNADVFLSIHADSYRTAAASGASVYVISNKGASSESADWLAERENRADLVGGTSINDKDDLLASVLLNMVMYQSLNDSLAMGQQVLKHLGGITKLHKKQVEQAAFVVLKSDLPSLLIELGFISNPAEARKLSTKAFQDKLARAIYSSVRNYMAQNPPPGTWLAWVRKGGGDGNVTHVIAPGDTLSEIALKYRVSLASIKAINGLSSDTILVGNVLKIPNS